MKTDFFFSLAVSYFWLSDICQSCSDLASDTSGEMVKSCFQGRGEQGSSWKHVYVVWSDQSLPTRVTVSKQHIPGHAAGVWVTEWIFKSHCKSHQKALPKPFPFHAHSQEPALGFGLVPGAPGLCSGSRLTLDTGSWTATSGPSKGGATGSSQGLVLLCLPP